MTIRIAVQPKLNQITRFGNFHSIDEAMQTISKLKTNITNEMWVEEELTGCKAVLHNVPEKTVLQYFLDA